MISLTSEQETNSIIIGNKYWQLDTVVIGKVISKVNRHRLVFAQSCSKCSPACGCVERLLDGS